MKIPRCLWKLIFFFCLGHSQASCLIANMLTFKTDFYLLFPSTLCYYICCRCVLEISSLERESTWKSSVSESKGAGGRDSAVDSSGIGVDKWQGGGISPLGTKACWSCHQEALRISYIIYLISQAWMRNKTENDITKLGFIQTKFLVFIKLFFVGLS